VRTTLAAVLVVAVALLAGAFLLVSLVRGSLRDGLETAAEERASTIADQVESSGLPDEPRGNDPEDDPGEADDPDDVIWQVTDPDGAVVRSSQSLPRALPSEDSDAVSVPGADHDYVVVTEDAGEYVVSAAVSLEEVDDSTSALVPPLLVGLPLLLLLVGGTTWVVTGRALAPVERIRREVEQVSGDRLDRRVPEPASRDEIHRLALTMNDMLRRLEQSSERQRQFVADASHELRSPLAALRQTAEVARAHPGALPAGELETTVLEEGLRMQRLVEQLLLLSRADEGVVLRSPRDVDLDDLVLTEVGRVRRDDLEVDVSGVGAGRVRGDEGSLGQVVRNLVDNAGRHARARIAVTVRESGGSVELVVEDDGQGVPEEERTRVFDRFVRLDDARSRDTGGSGLGLAIVAEIVRVHGGAASVESSALGGARFVVRLPAA
jgi:signal transduction histidine kinase